MPETVSTYDRLLVSVTLEKREGACALFVQKTPDMFTNLPSACKTLLVFFQKEFLKTKGEREKKGVRAEKRDRDAERERERDVSASTPSSVG